MERRRLDKGKRRLTWIEEDWIKEKEEWIKERED